MLYPYLMSAEEIRELSAGEVTNIDIYDEDQDLFAKDGLFDPVIFGGSAEVPSVKAKDEWDAMEKAKNIPFGKNFGHIELTCPVLNVLFIEEAAEVLGMEVPDLKRVAYYGGYVLLNDCGDRKKGELVSEKELSEDESLREVAGIGGKAIQKLLEDLHDDGNPENMVWTALPVIPPSARPYYFFSIEDSLSRVMTSDSNALYRIILNRNKRLKRLMEINAPEIILRNERRMLQENVDALLANGKYGIPKKSEKGNPLFSFSDILDGKRPLTEEEKGIILTGLGYNSTFSGVKVPVKANNIT